MSELTMDDLVQKYIQLRERKAQLKAEYENTVGPIDAVQDKIEALILQKFSEMGVESVRTKSGTAYTTIRSSAGMGDWDAFKGFLERQDNPLDFIERRVSKAAVEAFKAETGDLPPGVNWVETRVVNFRRT